jgi:hypothetical protein
LRIFNTLDSSEAANLFYGRFQSDMAAVHRIAARNGVPCSLSVQIMFPDGGTAPKDSVYYYCVSSDLFDTTLTMRMLFHHSNQVNVVDSVGIFNERDE